MLGYRKAQQKAPTPAPAPNADATTPPEASTAASSSGDNAASNSTAPKVNTKVLHVAGAGSGRRAGKTSSAELRIQKDLEDVDKRWKLTFPDPNNLLQFTFTLKPEEGIWAGHDHQFEFKISKDYPISAPKVLCKTKVYHPNIDPEGHVCLNILREDWKPVLTLNAVFVGLNFLFLEPNPDDPLDKEAADMYEKNKTKFIQIAKNFMRGNYYRY